MASILQSPSRLIECPEDLSGCQTLVLNARRVLYFVIDAEQGDTFVVVLGYFSGQLTDVITKDLIERIEDSSKLAVRDGILESLSNKNARLLFL